MRVVLRTRAQGLILSALGCAIVVISATQHHREQWLLSPALLPVAVGVVMIIIGILLAANKEADNTGSNDRNDDQQKVKANSPVYILILVVFFLLTHWVSILLLAPFFLCLAMWLLGERRIKLLTGVSLFTTLLVFLTFDLALGVSF